jgi:hypothetical protein
MKRVIALAGLTVLLAACGEKPDPRVVQEKLRHSPGFSEARRVCAQCHALPNPNQHPPVAWPSVVARMENYIRGSNKRMPTQSEHDALLGYFQANSTWK